MLGCKTDGRNNYEPLTQAAFVEALMKLLSKDPEKERDFLKRKSLIGYNYLPHTEKEKEKEKYIFRDLFEKEKDSAILDIV